MHVPSRLASSIAVSYSVSSGKLDVIFLKSIGKKFSILNIWFTYISFSSSNGTKCFEKDNCLVHMQIWCILATCSEAKVYPTSAFQLMLVSKIKKWLHLLLCNFSSRWNNSTCYKNFGDSLKSLKRLLLTDKTEIYWKILRKNISSKEQR